ncbi:RNA polymerase sigma-70 factor (ECF subfamily) [Polaromonas sp. CG_9.5]|nr:RNA polymerase sigma-70 factor (ECF subfamily) [Polaromonas sp. CG_9.5]
MTLRPTGLALRRSPEKQNVLGCGGLNAIIFRLNIHLPDTQLGMQTEPRNNDNAGQPGITPLATEQELSDFLKSVEKRAFKRSIYHVRDEEAALDIVQDSMMKLAQHYGDKPAAELPMLFQRILSNTTLDWFRRRKTRNALFSNMSDFASSGEDGDFDLLETLESLTNSEGTESAQDATERAEILHAIELQIKELPERQREAFLMRYWEEMDVAETAAAMGCSEGSVKTHCSRAVHALSKALSAKGIKL